MNEQKFEQLLQQVMRAPTPAADLQQKLLAIAETDPVDNVATLPTPARVAANDSLWRRALPVAACMAVFLWLANRFQPPVAPSIEDEILAHVHAEGRFLNADNHVSLDAVNQRMGDVIGVHLAASPTTEALDVRWSKDCLVDNKPAMHLIISGDTGPVSLMIVPDQVVNEEMAISDESMSGFITPVQGGTLVVLGNSKEPVRKYLDLMNKNLEWEY